MMAVLRSKMLVIVFEHLRKLEKKSTDLLDFLACGDGSKLWQSPK